MSRVEINETVTQSTRTGLRPVTGATVRVYERGTTTPVEWFVDEADDVTGSTEPLTTANGRIEAWVEQGSYDLYVTYGGTEYTQPFEAISAAHALTPESRSAVARVADLSITSPMLQIIDEFEFVASSVSAEWVLDMPVTYLDFGSSSAAFFLFFSPSSVPSPIYPVHQADALDTGVQRHFLGTVGTRKGRVFANVFLGETYDEDGNLLYPPLVPGESYKGELVGAITGLAVQYPLSNGPTFVAAAKAPIVRNTDYALPTTVAIHTGTDGKLHVFDYQGFTEPAEFTERGTGLALTGGTAFGYLAISPDGSKVVKCQQNPANNVAVVTTGARVRNASTGLIPVAASAPAVQGYYTPTGTTPSPTDAVITPDGLYAWITLKGVDKVVRMTLADGTFSNYIDLGAGAAPEQLALNPAGTTLLVGCPGTGLMKKIDTASGTVTGSMTPPRVACVAWDPLGADVAYVAGGTTVARIKPSDMTNISSPNADTITGSATRIRVFPDGQSLLVSSSSTASGQAVYHLLGNLTRIPDSEALSRYVRFPPGVGGVVITNQALYDIALNPFGAIFVACPSGQFTGVFPGGEARLKPASAFDADALRWTLRGAVAA